MKARSHWLYFFFFFLWARVDCYSLSEPMCVPCQTSAATGTSFDQRGNKASGVPVERGVLVKLQTWQHGGPSYCKLTDDPKTENWGLVEMNLPKNRNTCQHRGVRPPRPLRKHTLNPNHCNSEVSWKYIYITPGKLIMSGKTVEWIDYDPLENIHPVPNPKPGIRCRQLSPRWGLYGKGLNMKTERWRTQLMAKRFIPVLNPLENFSTPVSPSCDGLMIDNNLKDLKI